MILSVVTTAMLTLITHTKARKAENGWTEKKFPQMSDP